MKNPINIFTSTAIAALFSTTSVHAVIRPRAAVPATVNAPTTVVVPGTTTVVPTTPTPQATSFVLPAGTQLLVRMTDGVNSSTPAGTTFATTLDHNITAPNGSVALPAGTVIYGQVLGSSQAGRVAGQSSLELHLSQINAGGKQISIQTTAHGQVAERSGRKAARGAGLGAGIGAFAGNAGAGAAVGSVAGAARRPQSIAVPAGTLMQFTLTQPVTISH